MKFPVLYRKVIAYVIIALLMPCTISSALAREMVLVSGSSTIDRAFGKSELRRIFLGFSLLKNDIKVEGVRNISSTDIDDVFLQYVMFMSKHHYERRLLSLEFKKGNSKIIELDNRQELLDYLKLNPQAISYMWRDEIPDDSSVVVVQVLWSTQ